MIIEIAHEAGRSSQESDILCGRGSALWNRFLLSDGVSDRDACCDSYRDDLWRRYLGACLSDDERLQFAAILGKYRAGKVVLVCDCGTDRRCHCVTIRDVLLNLAERVRRKKGEGLRD